MFGKRKEDEYVPGALPCMTPLGCPESVLKPGSKGFCPFWTQTDMEETNVVTQEKRLAAGCFMPLIARWMAFVIPAANRTTESVDKLSNAVDAHNQAVGAAMNTVLSLVPELPKPGNGADSGVQLPDRISFHGG